LKKVIFLAAVIAMVLAAAAPGFGQATAVGGSVQYVDCDQIQAAVTSQYNTNNQQDMAGIAQELGVSQNQVLACFQSIAAGRNVNINTATPRAAAPKAAKTAAPKAAKTAAPKAAKTAAATATATASATATATATSAASASSAPAALPPTGGAPILALGAGVLLVASGLLARRIIR
jgi:hypothetical protein